MARHFYGEIGRRLFAIEREAIGAQAQDVGFVRRALRTPARIRGPPARKIGLCREREDAGVGRGLRRDIRRAELRQQLLEGKHFLDRRKVTGNRAHARTVTFPLVVM